MVMDIVPYMVVVCRVGIVVVACVCRGRLALALALLFGSAHERRVRSRRVLVKQGHELAFEEVCIECGVFVVLVCGEGESVMIEVSIGVVLMSSVFQAEKVVGLWAVRGEGWRVWGMIWWTGGVEHGRIGIGGQRRVVDDI